MTNSGSLFDETPSYLRSDYNNILVKLRYRTVGVQQVTVNDRYAFAYAYAYAYALHVHMMNGTCTVNGISESPISSERLP